MDRRVSRTIRLKSLLIATLVGILLGGVLYLVERPYYRLLATQERDRVQVWSARLGAALGTSVSRRLALLAGLKAHVVSIAIKDGNAEALNSSFEGFATGLYHSTPGVRNFIVAPAGVNKYVYPLERNKKALGHNIMADQRPTVRRDVQRTVETRMPALSGPYELRQGGLGLVVRDAVYLGDALWGLVSMVIDMPPVLEEAGVLEIPEGLVLGLHDVRGKLFYGSPEVFSLSPVLVKVLLPEGAWELGVVPKRGWGVSFDFAIAIFRGLALAIVLLAGTSAYLLSNRQQHLTLAVVERTDELSTLNADLKLENTRRRETEALMSRQQEYIQDIIDSMPSMIVGVTADGVIKLWNLRAADELGIMARDAVNSQLKDVAPGIVEYMSMVGRALETGEVQRDLRRHRLDAEEGLIEDVTVYPLGSERHEVVIRIDDVTERVGIEQRMIQTERMVSLGGLAAGMAHEINNPLGGCCKVSRISNGGWTPH
ncbi:CHASE domain-containing protein [Desulfovibrio ferrophilus]|uniref:Diguanylate cyclase n=1 Tax=Desulfovibrio ferrophilus TaxID=241368 RepID=A0A2Z6AZD3_9BACT|nr:CHASE domain-containing protein [Desulfovibrio ferrophilus]BBD08578.1 diguanylate cyclase [Desulfovibrio ferrophilus]